MSAENLIEKTNRTAAQLQQYHLELDSPWTQNVRNHLPMWCLVQQALPELPKHDEMVKIPVTTIGIYNGKQIIENNTIYRYVKDMEGGIEKWTEKALTAKEIMEKLKANGYLVSSLQQVRVALSSIPGIRKLPRNQNHLTKYYKIPQK